MQSFSFEVEKETGRAKVVVEYTYPDQAVFGLDGGLGPGPTLTQISGLSYDRAAHVIAYDAHGKRVTCATVSNHKLLFWRHVSVRPTGACTVSSQLTSYAEDSGWSIHRFRALDTFFESQ